MLLLAPPTTGGGTPTLDATRKSRKAGRSRGAFAFAFAFAFGLRSQRVDGRRLDAFVADLHCSRVHGGTAPIVSYVSALLRRSACVCAEGEAVEPNGALRATSASTVYRARLWDQGHR